MEFKTLMFNISNKLYSWIIFLTLACCLVIPDAYSYGAITLLALSPIVFFLPSSKHKLDKHDLYLIGSFIFYGACLCLYFLFLKGELRELNKPFLFILLSPVALAAIKANLNYNHLVLGTCAGALLALIYSGYQASFQNLVRPDGAIDGYFPIRFGTIVLLLGALSLPPVIHFLKVRKFLFAAFALISCMSGIYASFLSGSRGAWIALPILFIFVACQFHHLKYAKTKVLFITGLVVFCFSAVHLNFAAKNRISIAINEVSDYFQGENKSTSVGVRFELWKSHFYMLTDSPLFGVGESSKETFNEQLIEQEKIVKQVRVFGHAHSDYFEALGTRGLVGFFALLTLYLAPFFIFYHKGQTYKNNIKIQTLATSGCLIPLAYMCFGITNSLFYSNITTIMYILTTSFYWGAIKTQERLINNPP